MSRFFRGVWRHPQFRLLWAGQATSMFGSLIGNFAFSLVAIITLHASAGEVALLNACSLVPAVLAGPAIGALADRMRRRPLMIGADVGRALALASIPLAALTHHLGLLQLDAVAAVTSILSLAFTCC